MSSGTSKWALNVGTVSGIPIRIHLTFLLLLAWVALDARSYGAHPANEVIFVCGIFFCILLHELGHAIMAKQFGVRTSDIILYPFGGIASLASQVKPLAEFWIALAGPAVNLVIAMGLLQISKAPVADLPPQEVAQFLVSSNSMVDRLIIANIVLLLFNLLPAFPMDGGRVLRSALALLGVRSATWIAGRLSQILSVIFGAFGVYSGNPILLIIAVIVFSSAAREVVFSRETGYVSRLNVADVMIESPHLTILNHGLSARAAVPLILKSLQEYFPVLHGSTVLGLVSKSDILQSAGVDEEEQYVAGLAQREFSTVTPSTSLVEASELLFSLGGEPLLVMEGDKLCGLLTREKTVDGMVWTSVERHSSESES